MAAAEGLAGGWAEVAKEEEDLEEVAKEEEDLEEVVKEAVDCLAHGILL